MARPSTVLAVLLSFFSAAVTVAQNSPPPAGTVPQPLTSYIGRYLDSANTRDLQTPYRTLRAQLVKVAPDRNLILMKLGGSEFGVYQLSTFASRVASEPLTTALPHGEKYLPPDVFLVDPDRDPSWQTVLVDGQERLFDFDYDDRGYFYLAYSVYGWGIVNSSGALQSQVTGLMLPFAPVRILAVHDGTNMRAIVSDGSSTAFVYDVTNPAAPLFLRALSFGIQSWAKLASGGVAIVNANGRLEIYASGAALAAGSPPVQTFLPSPGWLYQLVATDGAMVFAAQSDSAGHTSLSVLSGAPGSYVLTSYPPIAGLFFATDLHYGAGFIVLSGGGLPLMRQVYFYRRNSPTPIDDSAYFTNAYAGISFLNIASMAPYASGGQAYLIAAMTGIGDLFALGLTATKQFAPSTILVGQTSTLTVSITNLGTAIASNLSFTDTYPSGLVNAAGTPTTTCGGTLTATPGAGSFSLSGGSLNAGATCQVTVPVTSTVAGTYTNTIPAGTVTATNTLNGADVSAALTVTLIAPTVTKAFTPALQGLNQPVHMTITLANSNAVAITGVGFTDTLPANLVLAPAVNASNGCGGTLTATSGGSSVALSGGTISPSGNCTITVDVVATAAGTLTNTIAAGAVTSANAPPNGAPASASLQVVRDIPAITPTALMALLAIMAVIALLRLRG